MNNIPVFTTENGIAALTLKQIPYRGEAFITYGAGEDTEALLKDCITFCRDSGAEKVYAAGFPGLAEKYPLAFEIFVMQADKGVFSGEIARLWPVVKENSEKWRSICNEKMKKVAGSAYIDFFDMKQQVRAGDCYFIHSGDALLGIGKASGNTVHLLASLVPGAGQLILCTLVSLLTENTVRLEVASTNEKAIKLYKSMGFLPVSVKESWYKII